MQKAVGSKSPERKNIWVRYCLLPSACCLLETTVKSLSRLIACHRFGCGR